MLFGNYRFSCIFDSDARLPEYKGSTFRGVFGHALKSVVCALKRQTCPECLLRSQCLYTLVFETDLAMPAPDGTKVSSPPHPFVIEPPLTDQTDYAPGNHFNFTLLLFGKVNRRLPYFIYAIENTGRIGVGARVKGSRGRFALKSVECGGTEIYSENETRLNAVEEIPDLGLDDYALQHVDNLRIRFETPFRVKHDSRLSHDLPFHVLVRAMLRRSSTLLASYGEGQPDIDYRGLVDRAKKVTTARSSLSWKDWRRYSQRQEQSMRLGGLIGDVVYEGDLAEFMPLIEFCQRVHIGKQTAFGLGKFTAEPVP